MTKGDIDQAREELRQDMLSHPHKPYGMGEIGKRFGISKHFIDRERALSYEGSHIVRSKAKGGGVRWTYVPEGSEPSGPIEVASEVNNLKSEDIFEPSIIEDERKRTLQEVAQRQGQPQFRKKLLAAYGGRCAITGCDAEAALEAVHILSYLGPKTNHLTNGLLLRADIHTLFDLNLIGVDPESLKVALSNELAGTTYDELDGRPLTLPKPKKVHPSLDALQKRWKQFVG